MLDFKELGQDGNDFELLIRELLFSMGMRVYWSGRGPDGGKDLLCVETPESKLLSTEKRWLIQCKHFAHSDRSVSPSDLDNIVDSCNHHGATGYLLVCSTYPSSGLVNRIDGISNNNRNNISTLYWDSVMIERMLSTPKTWKIAQQFFPVSANREGWRVYATENPNRWIVNINGYYIHLSNRIGSYAEIHLPSLTARIIDIESIPLPKKHMIRPRAVHYDDKNGNYTWYVDYLFPYPEAPYLLHGSIKELLCDGYALEDGQCYSFDVHLYSYRANSDHFDPDHYDYYQPFLGKFNWGGRRKEQDTHHRFYDIEGWELEYDQRERAANESFENLVNTFSSLNFVKIIRSENCNIEFIDTFNQSEDWSELFSVRNISPDQLFSALIIFKATDEKKLDRLMRKLPLSVLMHFTISKRFVYTPDMDVKEAVNEYFDWRITIHPGLMKNKFATRLKLSNYFKELNTTIVKFIEENS